LKFAHLVQINDPFNPLIEPLTRAQVWRGLELRARQPRRFSDTIDAATIDESGTNRLRRELRRGTLIVRDTVHLVPLERLVVEVEPGTGIGRSTLTTTIETPEPEQLFVRFEYETGTPTGEAPPEEFYAAFVRQAYVAADLDAIRLIRRLAADGDL
jgi:hypothetical protein